MGSRKAAFDFSNKISDISRANQDRWRKVAVEISKAEQSHDYTQLTPIIKELSDFLDAKTIEVQGMKDVAGSEEFKESMVKFLKIDKQIADENLTPFTQMKAETSAEEFHTATQALVDGANAEAPYLAKLQTAQRAYAKKNRFKIQNNPEK